MDSDQITSLDLPDFWVDYLDSGIRGSSLPWKEPTLAEGSACWGCISLSLAFKWVVGKELCSFPSSHNRGLHPIPGTASFPRGFWAERAQPLNLATLGQCDKLLLVESGSLMPAGEQHQGRKHLYRLSFSRHQAQHKPFGSPQSWPWRILPCL